MHRDRECALGDRRVASVRCACLTDLAPRFYAKFYAKKRPMVVIVRSSMSTLFSLEDMSARRKYRSVRKLRRHPKTRCYVSWRRIFSF